jgi:hypothetical protein
MSEHVEYFVQKPVQIIDKPAEPLPPAPKQEKVAPDDVLLMGMMIWMQDGILLDWMHQGKTETNDVDTESEDKEDSESE